MNSQIDFDPEIQGRKTRERGSNHGDHAATSGHEVCCSLESNQANFIRRGKFSLGNLAVERFEDEHYNVELLRIDGGSRQADADGEIFGRQNVVLYTVFVIDASYSVWWEGESTQIFLISLAR